MFIFLVGCLDYKAYDIPQEEVNEEEVNLIDEIAQIERELAQEEEITGETIEEISPPDETENHMDETDVETNMEETTPDVVEEVTPPTQESQDASTVITVKENELIKLKVDVTDPDKDPVTYSFTKPLDKNGTWKTNYGDAGEYLVTLTANDGKLTTSKKIKLVVERVNVPPKINQVKDMFVKEGDVVVFEAKVKDPNNDPVTITISEPLKSGKFVTDHTSSGEYQIKVMATDGELASEESFKLTIKDINELPVFSNLPAEITVKEGETIEIKPTITDLDEDPITLTISEPVGDDGLWKTDYTNHGDYKITVIANDGKNKVTKIVKVVIQDVNKPPEIVDISLI